MSCTKCQKNYSCETNVTIHMKEIHPDERRKAFNTECLDGVLCHRDYLEWETIITCIYNVTFASKEEQLMYTEGAYEKTQKKLKEKANETLVIPTKECEESDEKYLILPDKDHQAQIFLKPKRM